MIYKNCTIEPETSPTPVYFGVNKTGYQTKFVRVTFPDKTWIRAANHKEAKKYIDQNIAHHG